MRLALLFLLGMAGTAYAGEGIAAGGSIDAGQVIISLALAIIALEGRALMKKLDRLAAALLSLDRRLMHLEEWSHAQHGFDRRQDDATLET